MFTSKNTINILIGKNIARTGSVQITDPSATSTYIADGEVVVLDENDTPAAAPTITTSRYIKLVQRSGNELVFSARIDGNNVFRYTGKAYDAPREQVSYIGYNGTAGDIQAIALNNYKLTISYKHDKEKYSEQLNAKPYYYSSPATVTSSMVAYDFTYQIANDPSAEVRAERVVAGTGATPGAGNYIFTNGSDLITNPASTLTVGQVIRVGTTATSPAYIVTELLSTTSSRLDVAYQGTTVTHAAAAIETVATPTGWGIKLTGEALTFRVGIFKYVKVSFDTLLMNFGSTSYTLATTPYKGSGTYEEVAELEWFAVGFEGAVDRAWYARPIGRADAISGTTYRTFAIDWFDTSDTSHPVSGVKPSENLLYVFVASGTNQTTQIKTALDTYMASVPRAFAAVTV
jgi:hypothetical protein